MQKKQKKHFQPKIWWIALVAVIIFVGSILLSLKVDKEQLAYLPEPTHRASDALTLAALPAMANDVNLYNEHNILSLVSGSAVITHPDNREEKVERNGIVDSGDKISVSENGQAEILWFEGSVTRLAAGTEIEIREASYNVEDLNKTKIGLWANRGKIWAKVIKMVDGESEFRIESTSAIAGVRGTTFNYILENGRPVVEVIENEAYLEKKSDKSVVQLSGHQTGTMSQNDQLEVRPFDSKKLEQPYYAQNLEKDRLANEAFKEANWIKIREWAKPLPGDPAYIRKQEQIRDLLNRTEDPVLLKKFKARAEKLKVYETIALSNPTDLRTKLNEEKEKIQKTVWPDAEGNAIKAYLGNNLRHIERALGTEGEKATELKTSTNLKFEIVQPIQTKTVIAPQQRKRVNQERTTAKPKEEKPAVQTITSKEIVSGSGSSIQPDLTVQEKIQANREAWLKRVEVKKQHEAVQEKIQANREAWLKRVEERLQREKEIPQEVQMNQEEGNAPEKKIKDEKTGLKDQQGQSQTNKPEEVKTVGPDQSMKKTSKGREK